MPSPIFSFDTRRSQQITQTSQQLNADENGILPVLPGHNSENQGQQVLIASDPDREQGNATGNSSSSEEADGDDSGGRDADGDDDDSDDSDDNDSDNNDDDGDDMSVDEEPFERPHRNYRYREDWEPIVEDESRPCEDEMAFIESKTEYSALDQSYWEQKVFFQLLDPELYPVEHGRIDWTIDHFNGSKEFPNWNLLMCSDTKSIGGYDWRIKFFPHGDHTEFLSVYVECVSMRKGDVQEYKEDHLWPFPMLDGSPGVPVRISRTVAAQVGLIMYNPSEPRVYRHKADAFQYSKKSSELGWRYFSRNTRSHFHLREHGQRQAMLQNDKLAFSAYIRVVHDPTGCNWRQSTNKSAYDTSLMTTGLRPFVHRGAQIPAFLPLCHLTQFRALLRVSQSSDHKIKHLRAILHKMYTRSRSSSYGRKSSFDEGDAILFLRKIALSLRNEFGNNAVNEMIGSFDPARGSCIGHRRLSIQGHKTIQEAVNHHEFRIETPQLLTLELRRQDFDRTKRVWKKIVDPIAIDERVVVNRWSYTLFAFITHTGKLLSNRHQAYVRPGGPKSLWYAYQDGVVTAMTTYQALHEHSGFEPVDTESSIRRNGGSLCEENEVAYVVQYVRDDVADLAFSSPRTESFQPKPTKHDNGLSLLLSIPQITGQSTQEAAHGKGSRNSTGESGPATPHTPFPEDQDIVMHDQDTPSTVHRHTLSLLEGNNDSSSDRDLAAEVIIDGLGQDFYQGYMHENQRHGRGHWIQMNGDEYRGEFHLGQPHGQGTMIYSESGNVYEGAWKNGQHHGQGQLAEGSSGNLYDGGWREGRKHGKFVLSGEHSEEERTWCTICYENEISTAFYDCGHVIACRECAARVTECPVCRKRILARLQLYGVRLLSA